MQSPPIPPPSAADRLSVYLDLPVRVVLTDGRTIRGVLQCLDAHGNIILARAAQLEAPAAGSSTPPRAPVEIGVAMVPAKAMRSCHALAK